MKEWVLIMTMSLVNEPGSLNDVQFETISGFQTKIACEAASKKISLTLLRQVSKFRRQMKVPKNGAIDFPSVFSDCLEVQK
ncbi:hypothetical protein ACJJIW_12410 [Microbulbifer sp. JMSA004]|uniref:hypothetical protein n=1 Tax=Microbulbifer sp. JMSA004 TaxID=3243370 RepID=UPI00403A1BCF